MKGIRIHILALMVLMASVLSCGKHRHVMPRSVMEDVYVDLFLADQWLTYTKVPGQQKAADTTMFYEPVFQKHGYSTEDFVESVNYYLRDPKRYSRILRKAESRISDRVAYLRAAVEQGDEIERIYSVIKEYDHGLKLYYDTVYMKVCQSVGLVVKADSAGRYMPFIPQEVLDSIACQDSVRLDSLLRDSLLRDSLMLDSLKIGAVSDTVYKKPAKAPVRPKKPMTDEHRERMLHADLETPVK